MNINSIIKLAGLVFCIFLCGAFLLAEVTKESDPVAIICYIEGKAAVKSPSDAKLNELQLFDRLQTGTEIETASKSNVIITFFTGTQYEINELTKVTIEQNEIKSSKGSFKKLKAISAMPKIAPIAKDENPGKRAAAIRIRSGYAEGMDLLNPYPRNGATVLANSAILSFKRVEGIIKYKVEVEDELGNSIFSVITASNEIAISPQIFKDGSPYYWRVRTLDPQKPSVHAEAMFETVNAENARLRTLLQQKVEKEPDISLFMLLAEVDHNLGLIKESCAELKAAIAQSPDNPILQQTLTHFECVQFGILNE